MQRIEQGENVQCWTTQSKIMKFCTTLRLGRRAQCIWMTCVAAEQSWVCGVIAEGREEAKASHQGNYQRGESVTLLTVENQHITSEGSSWPAEFTFYCRMSPSQNQHHRSERKWTGPWQKSGRKWRQTSWLAMPAQKALRWRMRREKIKSKYRGHEVCLCDAPMQYVQLWFWLQTSRRCTTPSTRGRETVDSQGSAGGQCGRRFTASSTRGRETVSRQGCAGGQHGRRDTVLACEGKYRAS